MKSKKLACIMLSLAFASACLLGLASCSIKSGLTGGVAATVNGEKIMEDDVTEYIENFRKNNGLEDDEAWASWMEASGYTPETIREQVIDNMKDTELIKQAAQEKGITVSKADIDASVEAARSNFESDEAWESALAAAGMTEESYRESIEVPMLQKQLQEAVLEENAPEPATDEEVVNYLAQYAPLFDGAKRSSHILFKAGDEALAEEVLGRINSGELDFADAAKQYSTDTVSAEKGGDVGWDQLNTFVAEYTDALAGLEEGQVSGLVTSDYGIHIIKCTEVFTAPETVTSIDQVPSELAEYVRGVVDDNLKSSAYNDWLSEFVEKADVKINDMPEGLPYDVAISDDAAEGGEEASDAAGDGADDGDDTDDAAAADDAATDEGSAQEESEKEEK